MAWEIHLSLLLSRVSEINKGIDMEGVNGHLILLFIFYFVLILVICIALI